MTISAFRLASLCHLPSEHAKLGVATGRGVNTAQESDEDKNRESDSDDEEVAVTCFRGLRVDNEFDSSSDEEDDDAGSVAADDEPHESKTAEGDGLVLFVSERVPVCDDSPIVKPTPTAAAVLSPFGGLRKGDAFSDNGESSGCCVTKQMSPFILHDSFGKSNEGEMEDEDEDGSDDDSMVLSSSVDCDDLDIVSRVVSECTDGNIADAVEVDYFALEDSDDDDELSGILEALSQSPAADTQDETDSSDRIIGVMGDREDLLTIPKVKRVLSFNTLAELSEEAKLGIFSPKRPRLQSQPSTLLALNTPLMYKKPTISVDEEDEICSTMKDELFDYRGNSSDSNTREKAPIPLLTPPGSPLSFACDGDVATVCEWPYNLVVDSAMTAACELTPMSLASLEDLELRDTDFTELAC